MCRLPHQRRPKQYSMQWVQALGAKEVQWAQAPEKKDPNYWCSRYKETVRPIDARPQEVQFGSDKLEIVASFCVLGGHAL